MWVGIVAEILFDKFVASESLYSFSLHSSLYDALGSWPNSRALR